MSDMPDIGIYWTEGVLTTNQPMMLEAYSTCARCGSFVNATDRHEDWHRWIEGPRLPPGLMR